MTPEELKKSILQLAIQGKLVERRPEEGTAEDLYVRIQTEKQKLIKEGKIKKEKPLPEITDDEIPFDIPESWKWIKVGNVGSWSSGATPSRTNPEYYGGDIPWLKTGDLTDGLIECVPEFITQKALNETSVRLNPEGSVLMAMYGATIGKLGITTFPLTTNQACCACIVYSGVSNLYLFYYLMSMRTRYMDMAEGGAQPNISKEKIINSIIPLPPLEEQKRIVAKIEDLLPLVDKYADAYNRLEELNKTFPGDLKKSILQYAIQGKLVEQRPEEGTADDLYAQIQAEKQRLIKEGKIKKEKPLPEIIDDEIPFDIPESWKWVRLKPICTKIVDGDHNPPTGIKTSTEYLMLSATNINNDTLVDLDKVRYLSEDVFTIENERTKVEINDLFFTIVGSMGRTCVYKGGYNLCFQRSVAVITTLIYPEFLKYVLDSALTQDYMYANATGTAQKGFYLNQVDRLCIPLPPLEEQRRIVEKITTLFSVIDSMQT